MTIYIVTIAQYYAMRIANHSLYGHIFDHVDISLCSSTWQGCRQAQSQINTEDSKRDTEQGNSRPEKAPTSQHKMKCLYLKDVLPLLYGHGVGQKLYFANYAADETKDSDVTNGFCL